MFIFIFLPCAEEMILSHLILTTVRNKAPGFRLQLIPEARVNSTKYRYTKRTFPPPPSPSPSPSNRTSGNKKVSQFMLLPQKMISIWNKYYSAGKITMGGKRGLHGIEPNPAAQCFRFTSSWQNGVNLLPCL